MTPSNMLSCIRYCRVTADARANRRGLSSVIPLHRAGQPTVPGAEPGPLPNAGRDVIVSGRPHESIPSDVGKSFIRCPWVLQPGCAIIAFPKPSAGPASTVHQIDLRPDADPQHLERGQDPSKPDHQAAASIHPGTGGPTHGCPRP